MSLRPVKRIIESRPTIEGAGVRLRRAFGFGETADYDRFYCWMTSAMKILPTTWQAFPGTRTAASRPSRMFLRARYTIRIASATKASWEEAMCSG